MHSIAYNGSGLGEGGLKTNFTVTRYKSKLKITQFHFALSARFSPSPC